MSQPRLLFVYLSESSFVEDDRALLSERYDVRPFHFDAGRARSAAGLLRLLDEQRRWLRRELPGAAAVFGWFADYHMVLPVRAARRAGIPALVVLGGFESNTVPSLGYGAMLSRWRAPLVRFVVRNATHLLPVDAALIEAENRFADPPQVLRNGIRAHVSGPLPPLTVVPTGYDAAAWPAGPDARSASVLTVGYCASERAWKLKGFDLLVLAAGRMPGVRFDLVGIDPAFASSRSLPGNVRLHPPGSRASLAAWYASAAVYVQLSRSEGLPNVLCEAMLCGCVPVVSPVGGMASVADGVGGIVEKPDAETIVLALRAALSAGPEARSDARRRIRSRFSRERRRDALMSVLAAPDARGS